MFSAGAWMSREGEDQEFFFAALSDESFVISFVSSKRYKVIDFFSFNISTVFILDLPPTL